MKISLRKLNEFDLDFYSKWMRDEEFLNSVFPGVEVPAKEDVLISFLDILRNKKDFHFIVLDREKPVGLISLLKDRGDLFRMEVMIGEKEYWHKGGDIEAMKILIEMMEDKNMDLFLEVRPEKEKSIAVFTSLGFTSQKIKKYPRDDKFPEVLRMKLERSKLDFFDS